MNWRNSSAFTQATPANTSPSWPNKDALNASFHKVSEAMYQRAAEQSAPQDGSDGGADSNGATADEEDVVDAEVVDEGN